MFAARGFAMTLALLAGLPADAATIRVRDSVTGAPVDARLTLRADAVDDSARDEDRIEAVSGKSTRLPLRNGWWQVRIEAKGYRALDARLLEEPGALPVTFLLDPLRPPASFKALQRVAEQHPDSGWLTGHVRRADSGAPLANARVSNGLRTTRSDAEGYFELPLGEIRETGATPLQPRPLPDEFSLQVDVPGFAPWQRSGLLRTAGVQSLLVALGDDATAFTHAVIGARDRVLGDGVTADVVDSSASLSALAREKAALLAPSLAPPATIRVGFTDAACTTPCCTGSCPNSCTMSLETYVRRGLDSEWIASWHVQSLRAGSVAYRSYGAWRAQNPMNGSYDICSSACCQVNDAGTHLNTDAAVARTPGLMLSRQAGQAFSAEYSAENNAWDDPGDGLSCSNSDLSCGDGSVGSPSLDWPCLADAVASGHGCFGHGRGMSQWGSQRWAIHDTTPQTWRWIVEHYYNDNADATGAGSGLRTAVLTTPLALSGVLADPAQAFAGAVISLSAVAANSAGEAHEHLLIGASLYEVNASYIDDPANDASWSLAPGMHPLARDFHVPQGTPAGSYDVLYALWLDVDEDGLISSTDLPLAFVTEASAFEVLPPLFADGFEDAL